jgi:deazaflavin-dependent oxidoreductase (nitroreductase family)
VALDPRTRLGRVVQSIAGTKTFGRVAPHVVHRIDRTVYRLSGGRLLIGGSLVPTIVLTTTGAKTGAIRTTPLATLRDGDGWVVIGSNFGQQRHPAWSANLLADPDAQVSDRGQVTDVRARLLSDDEKATLWPRILEIWPTYDTYVERSGRNIRVFRLEPR